MHPDLYLLTYRRQEHDLAQRLEHRRVAAERASTSAGVAATPATHRSPATALRMAGPHLTGWLHRSRRADLGATASAPCCSPA